MTATKQPEKRIDIGIIARLEGDTLHIIGGGSEYICTETWKTLHPEHNVVHLPPVRNRAIRWAKKELSK